MTVDYAADGLVSCPTCQTASFTPLAGPPHPAVVCVTCGLGIERVLGIPPDAYERNEYASVRSAGTDGPAWGRWHHDVAVATLRLAQLTPLGLHGPGRGGRWVDFGCGLGAVPVVAERNGYRAVGVEQDTRTVAAPVKVLSSVDWIRYGLSDVCVVSMFDVLEHLPDPTSAIRAAARDLKAGGTFVVEVPDLDSADPFETWKHRRIHIRSDGTVFTEHVWHFSDRSLRAMVGKYAPALVHRTTGRPVPGKIQCVWSTSP